MSQTQDQTLNVCSFYKTYFFVWHYIFKCIKCLRLFDQHFPVWKLFNSENFLHIVYDAEIHFKDKPQLKKINFKRENVGNLQHLDQTKLSRLPLQITHAILALLKIMSNVPFKELSNSHKLYFKNPYIFATWRCKPFIFKLWLLDLA